MKILLSPGPVLFVCACSFSIQPLKKKILQKILSAVTPVLHGKPSASSLYRIKPTPGTSRALNLEFEVQNRFIHYGAERREIRPYAFSAKLDNDLLDYTEYRSIFQSLYSKHTGIKML